jgi:hypothetical protein
LYLVYPDVNVQEKQVIENIEYFVLSLFAPKPHPKIRKGDSVVKIKGFLQSALKEILVEILNCFIIRFKVEDLMPKNYGLILLGLIMLTACANGTPSQVAELTPTNILIPDSTATIASSPTPEPTPIGGSGRILLNVPSALYQETYPELKEGSHLFVLDLANNSLTPINHPGKQYTEIFNESPDGAYLPFMPYDRGSSEPLSLYLLDSSSLEVLLVADDFASYSDIVWLSENSFIFTAWGRQPQTSRIYYYEVGAPEPVAITPEGVYASGLLGADPSKGSIYWQDSEGMIFVSDLAGNMNTTSYSADDMEFAGITEDAKWIITWENRHGLALKSLDGSTTISVSAALNEMRTNPKSLPQHFNWSPDGKYSIFNLPGQGGISGPNVHCTLWESYLWDTEKNNLVNLGDGIPQSLECGSDIVWVPQRNQVIINTTFWAREFSLGTYYVISLETLSVINEVQNLWNGYKLSLSPDGNLALSLNYQMGPTIVNLEDFEVTPLGLPESWLNNPSFGVPGVGVIDGMWLGN